MIANFDMQKMERSLAEIVRLQDNGKINMDNPVQRGYVWDSKRDSLLIESLCLGMAISVFYYNRVGDTYELLEGKQRLSAISRFIKDQYKLSASISPVWDDEGNKVHLARKTFSQLPESLRNKILQTVPLAQYGENMTIEQKKIFFTRINSGKPVTAAEIARVGIISRDVILRLVEHPAIEFGVSKINRRKCIDEDIIKYIWAVLNLEKPDLDNRKLGKILEERRITKEEEYDIKEALDYLSFLFKAIGAEKKLTSKIKHKTHIVISTYMASVAIKNGKSVEEYVEKTINFFNTGNTTASISDAYNRASSSNTSNPKNVKIRMDEVRKALI